jgi:hypothetical protein
VPHEPLKGKWALIHLDDSCGLLRSSFMTFFGVIRFVLSISFQRYQWCCHRSFGMSAELFFFPCFSLSLSLSLLLISLYCKLCQVIFSIEESRRWHQQLLMSHICYLWFSKLCHFCDSRIADIICNSLNYTTFLNIFGAILFYLFFLHAKVQKFSLGGLK